MTKLFSRYTKFRMQIYVWKRDWNNIWSFAACIFRITCQSLSRRYHTRKAFYDKFPSTEGAPGVVLYFSSNFVLLLLESSIANLSVLSALFPGCILLNNALLSVSLSL
jgi:hypothetical protein